MRRRGQPQEVLTIDAVGVDDNFFELGGDSLLATKMTVRALKELKLEIPLGMLFRSPTIAHLATEIGTERARTADPAFLTLLDHVESMSDEEVNEWLRQHDA